MQTKLRFCIWLLTTTCNTCNKFWWYYASRFRRYLSLTIQFNSNEIRFTKEQKEQSASLSKADHPKQLPYLPTTKNEFVSKSPDKIIQMKPTRGPAWGLPHYVHQMVANAPNSRMYAKDKTTPIVLSAHNNDTRFYNLLQPNLNVRTIHMKSTP